MWHPAIRLADLQSALHLRIELDGRAVLIAWDGAQALAVNDTCPHRGARLSDGILRDGCVTCPAHLWRFSLTDGAKQGDPRLRIATYPTRIVNDRVEVDLPPQAPPKSLREALLAHARGEGS